jgi:hypothetical protein
VTIVQSPIIGNALRQALSLDAAGAMGLTMDPTIVPVALVADTVDRNAGRRSYSGWGQSAAVAAQFPTISLGIPAQPSKDFLYAIPRRVIFHASVTTFLYWRLGINTPPATIDAIPRELDTLAAAAGTLQVVRGATAVGVTAAQQNGLSYLPANQRVELELPEMVIRAPFPFSTLAGITFQGDVANLALIGEFYWDEYYRT